MKHTFDETTMQAAIDAACEALGKGDFRPTAGLLDTVPGCSDWSQETHARLYLAEKLLELLPESCELSTLRPISEAGDVPAGCVRVYGLWRRNKWVITMTCSQDTHCADIRLPESPKEANARAHAEFQAELEAVWNAPEVIRDGGEVLEEAEPVDLHAELKAAHAEGKVIEYNPDVPLGTWNVVHLPRWSEPVNQYRIKPTPETFTAHGKEWTPAVGDVVTLKSGGPKMTVLDPHPICYCSWFNDGEFYSNNFPASTLIPA